MKYKYTNITIIAMQIIDFRQSPPFVDEDSRNNH